MVSEVSGELFKNIETIESKSGIIRRIRKFCDGDGRTYITEETFDKEFEILVEKNGNVYPYLKTKHCASIMDSFGLKDEHINIARKVLDLFYEKSFLRAENGTAKWTSEELTEFTIEVLEEELVYGKDKNITCEGIIDYSNIHKRDIFFRKELS